MKKRPGPFREPGLFIALGMSARADAVVLAAAGARRGQHHGREADDAEDDEQEGQRAAGVAGAADGVSLRASGTSVSASTPPSEPQR